MNDLKNVLKQAMLYQFWILSGIVLLASGIVFYLTNSGLTEMITQRFGAIDGSFAKLTTVRTSVPTHPNATSHAEMAKIVKKLEGDVQEAWRSQYERQRGLLKWPREAFANDKTFELFDSWRPFEKYADDAAKNTEITINDRRVYRDYIGPVFQNISKIIGTEWKAKLGVASATSYPGAGGPPGGFGSFSPSAPVDPFSKDLVRWSESSQQELLNAIIPWYAESEPPTVAQIYYTQEDIWLLTGLMNIIKNTNSEANENFQAIVKEIEWIRMGQKASRDAGKLTAAEIATTGGGMNGPPGGYSGGGGGMMGSQPPGGYSTGGRSDLANQLAGRKVAAPDPADGRYVSPQFVAIKAKDLKEAIKNVKAANAMSAVARRVPVRMRLKVDQSRLNQLIAACGSADMMLEVIQVRLNTDPAEAVTGGGGGGASGGSARPGFGGGAGAGASSGSSMQSEGGESSSSSYPGGGYPGGGASAASAAEQLTETPVEIFGLIYLYNPVNIGTLGGDKVTAKPIDFSGQAAAAEEADAAAATNAATTAPANNGNAAAAGTNATNGAQTPPPTTPPPATTPPATTPPTTTPPTTTPPNDD